VLIAILVLVTLLEFLLGIGSFTGVTFITRAGPACGIISAIQGNPKGNQRDEQS
jgi:succinate-acetate transporter protein